MKVEHFTQNNINNINLFSILFMIIIVIFLVIMLQFLYVLIKVSLYQIRYIVLNKYTYYIQTKKKELLKSFYFPIFPFIHI